ncbi:MAG TPA: redox-regulated ATPase YchF [Methanocella sp.]|nr:redox-regulated ATPase YchF [Methanocella sp.]
MTITIALAGKPNAGKSSFFKSATLVDVEIASYPFTTIKANHGVSYVRTVCPSAELKVECTKCISGERFIAVELLDVAGLVPDACKGKGLGNKFLDDMRQAEAIIHVVDASGGTDLEGNIVPAGSHDPLDDINFLENEITMWMYGILSSNWMKLAKKSGSGMAKVEEVVAEQFAGLGINDLMARQAIHSLGLDSKAIAHWDEEDMVKLSEMLRRVSKPMIIVANKADIAPPGNIEKLKGLEKQGYKVIPCSAGIELALRMAAKNGYIDYLPGDSDFTVKDPAKLSPQQKAALEKMREFLKKNGGTGIQKCMNMVVFDLMGFIVVYPVEDETHYTNKDGVAFPDAFLVKKGSTAKDLAYRIHTQIGDSFLFGVNARTKMRLGEKHELANNDIIKITSTK